MPFMTFILFLDALNSVYFRTSFRRTTFPFLVISDLYSVIRGENIVFIIIFCVLPEAVMNRFLKSVFG